MSDIENREVFSANLRRYMEMAGVSRADVCNALGFKYTTFTDWYNGNKYPRIDKIEMLANFFGIEKSDLIEKKKPHQAKQVSDEDLKFALFEGAEVDITDEMFNEVKTYAAFVAQREKNKKGK